MKKTLSILTTAMCLSAMSGIVPQYAFAEGSTTTAETEIVYGDADMNGEIAINDAVKIMSSVSNSDKYELSETAQEAADVYNCGDGVNNMDALAVQENLAGLITELPVSYMDDAENQNMGIFSIKATDYFYTEFIAGAKIVITGEVKSLDETAEVPEIAFESVEKYTSDNDFTEFELPKYYDESKGMYWQYHMKVTEAPDGFRLAKCYSYIYDFNFLGEDSAETKELIAELLNEEHIKKNLPTIRIEVNPKKYHYTSEDKEIDIEHSYVNLYCTDSETGREELWYRNLTIDNLDQVTDIPWFNELTFGTLDNVVEGVNYIPVHFKRYLHECDEYVEAEAYMEIYYTAEPNKESEQEAEQDPNMAIGFLNVNVTDENGNPVPNVKVFVQGEFKTKDGSGKIPEIDAGSTYSFTDENGNILFDMPNNILPDDNLYITYHMEIQDIPEGYELSKYPDGFDCNFLNEKEFEINEVLIKK